MSAQQLVDCVKKNRGCKGGLLEHAFEWIRDNGGLVADKVYPYVAKQERCRRIPNKRAYRAKITDYELVPEKNETALRWAVSRQPVSAAVDTSNWEDYNGHGVFREAQCGFNPVHNHAVTIVGYGRTSRRGIKYWIVKNSYGKTWKNDGYILLERDVTSNNGTCGLAMLAMYPVI